MFEKCSEVKVLRDPVHGYIHVHYQLIWNLIATPEFQRLRRIHQFGVTYQVYHTGEHSRFAHSLGVYEMARRMVNEVKGLKEKLSETEEVAVLCAALLHDLGHGPFSHSFEGISEIHHEVFSDRYILEATQVHRCLEEAQTGLAQCVADIIAHRHPNQLLTQLVSGQIDADRMDYLLRDSYFSGVSYGEFDRERILRTLRIVDGKLVVKESGVNAVEDYIMARYHMYWQVYYHPTSLAVEVMIANLFKRLKDVYDEGHLEYFKEVPFFIPFMTKERIPLEAHFELDENTCMYGFSQLRHSKDAILSDLAERVLNRRLFKYETLHQQADYDQKKQALIAAGYDPRYYLAKSTMQQRPYNPYKEDSASLIYILKEDQSLVELSHASVIVDALVKGEDKQEKKMFYPKLEGVIHES